ncbi:MAG: nucleotidyltransferase domain-containing protein [Spirochaetota bacterium]
MLTVEIEALQKIKERLLQIIPEHFVCMYAFGSRVRGDFTAGSDFDVLIVIKKKIPQLEDMIVSILVNEELKYNVSFSPLIKDEYAFELEKQYNSPFYDNIINEGIKI